MDGQGGPVPEEDALSGAGDEVLFAGRSVAGSSVAEAACRVAVGYAGALAGFTPSTFDAHPLPLEHREAGRTSRVDVENYWTHETLEHRLRTLEPPIRSWADFDRTARRDFPELVFGRDCLRLEGHPFNPGVADRIRRLLEMLSAMKRSILPDGTYGNEWNELWDRWFRGGELFSDSSESEKIELDRQLTFDHPAAPGVALKCPWHGKVNTPKMRVHFSYPIKRDEPTCVVYIRPKITRRG